MSTDMTCLSMHQPWASLLVYGIKRIEGRTWTTEFKGRLWIHSTSKAPDPSEVAELEAMYRNIHRLDGREITFPTAYPTGVLLGCVDVVDVLPSEEVQSWPCLPDSLRQEAVAPYCFLCQAPKRLVVPQQLLGQPKLWQLTKKVLQVALQGLRDPPSGVAPLQWKDYVPTSAAAPAAGNGTGQHADRSKAAAAGKPGAQPQGKAAAEAPHDQQRQTAGVVLMPSSSEECLKRERALQKKLRQIHEIEAKGSGGGGETLPAEQAAKVQRRGEVEEELARLQAWRMLQQQQQGEGQA